MPKLRALLSDHKIVPLLATRLRKAIDKVNYTEREILDCAFPVDFPSGIYFLIRDEQIRYIGKSESVLKRILKHQYNKRPFDSFAFIPCPPEQLNELETAYITFLMPEENTRLS